MFSANHFLGAPHVSPSIFGGGLGLGTSVSGEVVNSKTAMNNSALNRCVTLNATTLAQLPCVLYQRLEGGAREEAVDHPLFDLLRVQPNQKDTPFEYFETGMGHLGLGGNHYALVDRNDDFEIEELIWVHPDKVQPLKGSDGLPYYRLLDEGNKVVGRDVMHHVKGMSLDGYTGLSPLLSAPDTVGLALATEKHAGSVFSQGTTMSGVIERPADVPAINTQDGIDEVVSSFEARHSGGIRNKFKVGLLQEGMTYRQMAMTNEQAQMIEARKMGVLDIARLYGVPPSMLGQSDGESYKSVEQTTLNYLIYGLMPWIRRWESSMMRDLLLKRERKGLYIEFNVSSLVRGDISTRYECYAIGRQWGWLSVNDIRRMENLPPVTGGDVYSTPLNMTELGKPTGSVKSKGREQKASQQQLDEIGSLCR